MTNNVSMIPSRLRNASKEDPYVAGAVDIYDDTLDKPQSEVNQDMIQETGTLDGKIATEKERAEGVEAGLRESIDELGTISVDPENAISTSGADFKGDTLEKRSKIPTIGAVIDGINDVYDVTANNSGATFASLSALLSDTNIDTLIPTARRKGGMSIKFIQGTVQSSDNIYVQCRLRTQEFSTDPADWQSVDDIEKVVFGIPNIDMFVNSSGKWFVSVNKTYKAFVIPVNQDDVIYAKWKGLAASTTGLRDLYADYPEYLQTATGLLTPSVPETLEETLTMPSDGYFVFWVIYGNVDHTPQRLTLNGENILSQTKDVRTLAEENKDSIFELENKTDDIVEELKEDVEELKEDTSSLEGDIATIKSDIGDVKQGIVDITLPSASNGGIQAASVVGSTIAISTSSSYKNVTIPVLPNELYLVSTKVSTDPNVTNYINFIAVTDANDVVLALYASKDGSDANPGTWEQIGTSTSTLYKGQYTIQIPANGVKMYIASRGNFDENIWAKKTTTISLQEQIDSITPDNNYEKIGFPLLDDVRPAILDYNKANKFLNFAMITDTHCRIDDDYNRNPINNMKLFSAFANEGICDFCLHGGDIITSYYLSVAQCIDWMDDSMRIFGNIDIPFYVVKGNHDFGGRENSGPGGSADSTCISETQTHILTQNHLDVTPNPNDKYGNYFYKDYPNEQMRVIVLNEYVVKNYAVNVTYMAEEMQWLAEVALMIPSGYDVVVFSHHGTAERITRVLSAFNTGGTLQVTDSGYSIDVDYSSIGSKHLVALIHGHTHNDDYSNTNGYNFIGVEAGFVENAADIGTAKEYKFSVFTVDTVNKVLYETRIGQQWSESGRTQDRSWSYDTIEELT